MEAPLLWIVVGAATAGFVQGLTGFGFGLVAMSFWAWVLDPRLAAVLGPTIACMTNVVAMKLQGSGALAACIGKRKAALFARRVCAALSPIRWKDRFPD